MKILKNLGNWSLVAAVYALVIITLGGWWKLMVNLFCVGYGC